MGKKRFFSKNYIYIYIYMCVCVCVREREREREKIVSHMVDDLLLMAELVDEFC